MSIIRSIPVDKIIAGNLVKTSELAIVAEKEYSTNGEYALVVRNVSECKITLNSKTTDRIKIKAMTKVSIFPDKNKIDEDWDVLDLDRGACVELVHLNQTWFILSSDGLKMW